MAKSIRIGTRPSRLAVKQAEEIISSLHGARFEIVRIETAGDRDRRTPLSMLEGSDFFTREIEEALLAGRIDAAVHSAKDVEEKPPKDLVIVAVTASISPYDCLVSKGREPLGRLPGGAVVGTSSTKRKEAVLKFRNDLIIKDIRGNVEERLARLDNGEYDAIIAAHAALMRLGYEDRIAEIIPDAVIKTHPLQGSLAIQIHKERRDLAGIFGRLDERLKG